MRTLFKIAFATTLLATAIAAEAACARCDPILNISNAPVTSASGKALSDKQVKEAIVRAGAALGWQVAEDGPGKLTATLLIRKHTAVVEIPYSSQTYAITYKTSTNLNEEGGQIHKNYNGWIQNFNKGIAAQLAAS